MIKIKQNELNHFIVELLQVPVIAFKFVNGDVLRGKLERAADYEGIIFTSPR